MTILGVPGQVPKRGPFFGPFWPVLGQKGHFVGQIPLFRLRAENRGSRNDPIFGVKGPKSTDKTSIFGLFWVPFWTPRGRKGAKKMGFCLQMAQDLSKGGSQKWAKMGHFGTSKSPFLRPGRLVSGFWPFWLKNDPKKGSKMTHFGTPF